MSVFKGFYTCLINTVFLLLSRMKSVSGDIKPLCEEMV